MKKLIIIAIVLLSVNIAYSATKKVVKPIPVVNGFCLNRVFTGDNRLSLIPEKDCMKGAVVYQLTGFAK